MTSETNMYRSAALAALALAATVAATLAFAVSSASAAPAGTTNFVAKFNQSFTDKYTAAPNAQQQQFFKNTYGGMIVSSPYFDSRIRFFRKAWVYRSLYGIFPGASVVKRHPSWFLKTSKRGGLAHVPFNCAGGVCPQLAGDITNPKFRKAWISQARREVRRGYRTVFIDEVNMVRRVSTSSGREIAPYSPYKRKRLSVKAWRTAVASFTRQIRRSLPRKVQIAHNVIWFAPKNKDRLTRLQMKSANIISLERGVNDSGLTNAGFFGVRNFLNYTSFIHKLGRRVIFIEDADDAPTPQARVYGLAGYLLMNTGRDMLSNDKYGLPDNFWAGYRVKLGKATSKRYLWRGMLRRNFQNGIVLLNQPGSPVRAVPLGGNYKNAGESTTVNSVTLGPANGAVLVR